jgi:hypothetical protein
MRGKKFDRIFGILKDAVNLNSPFARNLGENRNGEPKMGVWKTLPLGHLRNREVVL